MDVYSALFILPLAVITCATQRFAKMGFRINFKRAQCKVQMNQPCNSNENIKFFLYTSDGVKEKLDLKNKLVPEIYDASLDLKVVIHGYSSVEFMDDVIQGYLERGTDSVLVVDWEELAPKPCYVSAKMNTMQVGRCTGEALAMLRPEGELHIIGFSLGAHVAGHVSKYLADQGIVVDRITGLDPALPLYATSLDEFKLDKSDAKFVDVIHTDPGIYGKVEPSGHVDFYINGASSIQPGCYNVSNPPLCSHRRASEVFGESITSAKGFWGIKCPNLFYHLAGFCKQVNVDSKNKILMGENTNHTSRGIYYVPTNMFHPYALVRSVDGFHPQPTPINFQ